MMVHRACAPGTRDASADYNRVRIITTPHQIPGEPILRQIGEVFLKHRVHCQFGLALLHRHVDLKPRHAMVHRRRHDTTEICTMEPAGLSQIYPLSFYITETGVSEPFEYSDETHCGPPPLFITELGSMFKMNGYEKTFCVTYLSSLNGLLVERELPDGRGTIATSMDEKEYSGGGVTTVWAFDPGESGMVVKARRVCETQQSGGHKVT